MIARVRGNPWLIVSVVTVMALSTVTVAVTAGLSQEFRSQGPAGAVGPGSHISSFSESMPLTSSNGTAGANWNQRAPALSPSPRAGAAAVYDPTDGYTVLFGGCAAWGGDYWAHSCVALGDTWTFRGGTWTNITASLVGASPPPRVDAGMAFDSANGYVVMFGGFDGSTCYNDTWTFAAGHWTEMHPNTSPSPRFSPGMAGYDAGGETILFGGTNFIVQFGDTWAYRAGQWSRLSPAAAPLPRFSVAMAYDPLDQSVLLFGGWSELHSSFGDTWTFAHGNWTQLSGVSSPPAENYPSIVYDAALGSMIMTGGHSGEVVSNVTWSFTPNGGWSLLLTTSAPPSRWGAALTYDPASGAVWLFGGFDAYGPLPTLVYFGDTWEFGLPGPSPTGTSLELVLFGAFAAAGVVVIVVLVLRSGPKRRSPRAGKRA